MHNFVFPWKPNAKSQPFCVHCTINFQRIMNFILKVLQIVQIVPRGHTMILDRLGLVLWSGLSITIALAIQTPHSDYYLKLLNSHDIYTLFVFLMQFFHPIMISTLTIPSIYFMVARIPALFKNNDKLNLDHKTLFFVDMLLEFITGFGYVWILLHQQVLSMAYTILVLLYFAVLSFLMALTTFMLGIAMSQLKRSQSEHPLTIDCHFASQKLNDFILLKTGCSILLFVVYAGRAMSLTIIIVSLFSGYDHVPQLLLAIMLAYSAVDLVYINVVTTEAYDYIQSITLKLR